MRPSIADARSIALQLLIFLAADDERMERFLALTGTNPGEIRALADNAGFCRALLEHVCSDEPLLVAFAAAENCDPQRVVAACVALGGTGFE
ncbi:DUF3572 domain-containing protein [Methylosinus sp. Sm6]|uniref:DUF3572 domain-containing protein n=1 Tax=Methylosinus sp. Sm6 TaxID=2866948 RepID=UPI002103BBDC|nr:DUF3572 domain-containing protein [Methylosinus sp. Sm6]